MCVCASFQAKKTGLTFLAQICPKVDLGLAIQKTILGIRISILDIPCVPISVKMNNFEFFDLNLSKKKDLEFKTEKNNVAIRINIVETLCVPIFSQTVQL